MNNLLRERVEKVCFCFMLFATVCFLCGLQVRAEEGETVQIYKDNKKSIGEDMNLIFPGATLVLDKQTVGKIQNDRLEALLEAYFKAMESGDAQALSQLYHKEPEQTELLRFQCKGKYIERIENVEFYEVKDDRLAGSVVAVTYDCLFQDTNIFLPGYICLYVKKDAQKKELYLDGEMDLNIVSHMDLKGEERYWFERIQEESVKVWNMMQEVTEEYDALLLANPSLREKVDEININVGMDMDKESIRHEEELY